MLFSSLASVLHFTYFLVFINGKNKNPHLNIGSRVPDLNFRLVGDNYSR